MNGDVPTLTIRIPLEGRVRIVEEADRDRRLRDYVAANTDGIVMQLGDALRALCAEDEGDIARAVAAAGETIARNACTIAEVVRRATSGDDSARDWLAWALRNLDAPDTRFAAATLYLEHHAPALLASLETVRGRSL